MIELRGSSYGNSSVTENLWLFHQKAIKQMDVLLLVLLVIVEFVGTKVEKVELLGEEGVGLIDKVLSDWLI